jgi:hypothetical protein
VRASVGNALADGTRGVTAKIRWLSRAIPDLDESYEEGRPRWIHCTPLLGQSGAVGVWMVVLIDEDRNGPARRFRQAPPIANDVRSNHSGGADSGRNRQDAYEELDFDTPSTSQTASRNEIRAHGPGAARMETLRQPASPRSQGGMYEQRNLRSATSSIRDYAIGQGHSNGSTETFDI